MNTAMQTSLDNVDNALAKLLDSIASYHPSPAAGQELKEADNQLTKNLETLETHQALYAEIQALRTTSKSLDDTLTEQLVTLSEIRKELLSSTPQTSYPGRDAKPIPYADLLSYASRIARFSRPANLAGFAESVTTQRKAESAALALATAGPDSTSGAAAEAQKLQEEQERLQKDREQGIFTSDYLDNTWNPQSGSHFEPWPSEPIMKASGLMTLKEGMVPFDMLSEEEREKVVKERERQERLERGELDPEEEERVRREQVRKEEEEAKRRTSYAVGVENKPAQKPISLDLWTEDDN